MIPHDNPSHLARKRNKKHSWGSYTRKIKQAKKSNKQKHKKILVSHLNVSDPITSSGYKIHKQLLVSGISADKSLDEK